MVHNCSIFPLEPCNDERVTSSLLGNRYRDTGAVATVVSDELSSDDASSFQFLLDLVRMMLGSGNAVRYIELVHNMSQRC